MSVINDEQSKRDEQALAIFLIFFDLSLFGLLTVNTRASGAIPLW